MNISVDMVLDFSEELYTVYRFSGERPGVPATLLMTKGNPIDQEWEWDSPRAFHRR